MIKIKLSKKKITDLEKELKALKKDMLRQHSVEKARILESFRDAAAYDVSVQVQESRINELENILDKAEILPEKVDSEDITLGSYFNIRDDSEKVHKYRLVHPIESDPGNGLISSESPLGQKVMKRKKGDTIKLNTKKNLIIKVF